MEGMLDHPQKEQEPVRPWCPSAEQLLGMDSTIQSERLFHVAADLCLKTLVGCLKGGVLSAKTEVKALHELLPLDVTGQEVQLVGQLVSQ